MRRPVKAASGVSSDMAGAFGGDFANHFTIQGVGAGDLGGPAEALLDGDAAVQAALLNYQVNLDIGGVTLPGEGTNIAPYDEILGIAESALPQILNITPFKLNGATADVSLGPTGLLSFSSFSFTIIPV